jgi:outer membrane murein-binding lipoprotein Lpp
MSEDLTKKLPKSDRDAILEAIRNLESYVRSSIDNLVTWVGNINSRLSALDQKVEHRLYDTRPIWHKVVADVAQLQSGQDVLNSQVTKLTNSVQDIRRDQGVFNDAIHKINGDLHGINDRLHRLEVDRKGQNSST